MSINRQMDKEGRVHIYKEYYSAIKRNETWPFAMAWMGLEGLLLSEVSQTGKDKCHMISVLCEILKIK